MEDLRIAYYVSSHGFGHISRSFEVIKKISQFNFVNVIHLKTLRHNFIRQAPAKLINHPLSCDVGVSQIDGISINIAQTKENIAVFANQKENLITQEMDFCRDQRINLVISDSASLPFVISHNLGIQSLFIGNFTWDSIYQDYAELDPFFRQAALIASNEYSHCHQALILPFNLPCDCFVRRRKIGLVGRRPSQSKQQCRQQLGFKDGNIYFLLSFGAYALTATGFDQSRLAQHWRILSQGEFGFGGDSFIDMPDVYYPNLIAACDYVVSKPGYGIVSECIYADTPLIYTQRGRFAEYSPMVAQLAQTHASCFLNQSDLYRFNFAPAMDEIQNQRQFKLSWSDGLDDISTEVNSIYNQT